MNEIELDAPLKGMTELTLLSTEARLKGRPKICSDCGLCDSELKPLMPKACVFIANSISAIEQRLHGRQRNTPDEMLWDMTRAIIVPYHVYEALHP